MKEIFLLLHGDTDATEKGYLPVTDVLFPPGVEKN
jgi:hypothetical protein